MITTSASSTALTNRRRTISEELPPSQRTSCLIPSPASRAEWGGFGFTFGGFIRRADEEKVSPDCGQNESTFNYLLDVAIDSQQVECVGHQSKNQYSYDGSPDRPIAS